MIEARAKATSIEVTPETLNNPEAFKKFQSAQGELGSALSRLTECLHTVEVRFCVEASATSRFEDGLTPALQEVSAPLVQHFPARPGSPDPNELPDHPAAG